MITNKLLEKRLEKIENLINVTDKATTETKTKLIDLYRSLGVELNTIQLSNISSFSGDVKELLNYSITILSDEQLDNILEED